MATSIMRCFTYQAFVSRIRQGSPKQMSTNTEGLWVTLQNCWSIIIDCLNLEKLVNKIPGICKALIKTNGHYFNESRLHKTT